MGFCGCCWRTLLYQLFFFSFFNPKDDDDDDDDVVITHRDQGPCSSREPEGDVREAEDDCDGEDESNELERSDGLEKATIHPMSSAVVEDVDDDEVVEDVDDDEENDIDDDGDEDDDMCEITDAPAPARGWQMIVLICLS